MSLNLFTFLCLAAATAHAVKPFPHPYRRDNTCTVNAAINGTSAIYQAIQACNGTGTIIFPSNQTFFIDQPLNLSTCASCDFQIEGRLRVTDDLDYWAKFDTVISITNARGLRLRSLTGTGIIEGHGGVLWGINPGLIPSSPAPVLIRTRNSSDIQIANLLLKDSADDYIWSDVGSSDISISNISTIATYGWGRPLYESKFPTAIVVTNSQRVSITSVFVNVGRITGSCIDIRPGTAGASTVNTTCTNSAGNGLVLRFPPGGTNGANVSISDIVFSNNTVIGLAHPTGFSYSRSTSVVPHIKNVTWENIRIVNEVSPYRAIAEAWCDPWWENDCYRRGGVAGVTLEEVVFRDYIGANISATMAGCVPKSTICDVTVNGVPASMGVWGSWPAK